MPAMCGRSFPFVDSRENCWPLCWPSGQRESFMLTDVAIRKARSGERLAKLSDGGGLQLWITPTGGKLWYLAYRFGGRQKKLDIGRDGASPGAGPPARA